MAVVLILFVTVLASSLVYLTPVPQANANSGQNINLDSLDLEAYRRRPFENGYRVIQPCYELKEALSGGVALTPDIRVRENVYNNNDIMPVKFYNVTALREQCTALGDDYANMRFLFNASTYEPQRNTIRRTLTGRVLSSLG